MSLARSSMSGAYDRLHFPSGGVADELPRRRELAEAMSHHVLGDEHGDEELAVVDVEREAHELRRDHRAPRPGPHHLLGAGAEHAVDLALEAGVDVGALL